MQQAPAKACSEKAGSRPSNPHGAQDDQAYCLSRRVDTMKEDAKHNPNITADDATPVIGPGPKPSLPLACQTTQHADPREKYNLRYLRSLAFNNLGDKIKDRASWEALRGEYVVQATTGPAVGNVARKNDYAELKIELRLCTCGDAFVLMLAAVRLSRSGCQDLHPEEALAVSGGLHNCRLLSPRPQMAKTAWFSWRLAEDARKNTSVSFIAKPRPRPRSV
jgi:hypothetical protein